jgi:hypothetical protein
MNNKVNLESLTIPNWKTYLVMTLLITAVLIQVVVLRWSLEAVFFATWFLLMLVVKHDTRLSPALGLIFLATCPFLLIADKEPAAEQAANYAYFFLAIGVLVQLEEMILERNERLGWKVDLSFLWEQPAERLSTFSGIIPFGSEAKQAQTKPSRWILMVGVGGLVLLYLIAALSGVSQAILLPLLGGSILFLFLVLGLRLVLLAFGRVRLAEAAGLLLLLPMVVMTGMWINGLISAYRLARMEVAYDFIEQLDDARRSIPALEGEAVEVQMWTIGDESQQVLYQHPGLSEPSRVIFVVNVELGARLAFDLATSPESWKRPGDGVDFTIYIDAEGEESQLFSSYIDPKHDELDRRWHPYTVELNKYAGKEVSIIFETDSGPADDHRFDWAGWGEPRLLIP